MILAWVTSRPVLTMRTGLTLLGKRIYLMASLLPVTFYNNPFSILTGPSALSLDDVSAHIWSSATFYVVNR